MTREVGAPAQLSRSVGQSVFGADVAGYEAARIGYPEALYAALKGQYGGACRTIVEIGPGTGLATRDLLQNLDPELLVAVEVDATLAAHLKTQLPDPRLRVICSEFISADIEPGFDMACSAAAFHWLDAQAAFSKLRTILRPGGRLALWWNVYRQTGIGDAFADAVTPLLAGIDLPPSEGANGHYALDTDHHRNALTQAGFTHFEPHLFRRERLLSTQDIRALYASYSFVRALDHTHRHRLLDDIGDLAETHFGGQVPNVTLTPLYLSNAPAA